MQNRQGFRNLGVAPVQPGFCRVQWKPKIVLAHRKGQGAVDWYRNLIAVLF